MPGLLNEESPAAYLRSFETANKKYREAKASGINFDALEKDINHLLNSDRPPSPVTRLPKLPSVESFFQFNEPDPFKDSYY